MQPDPNQRKISPSRLNTYLGCEHSAELDLLSQMGRVDRLKRRDPSAEVRAELGNRHEAAFLQAIKNEGAAVAEIDLALTWPEAASRTEAAMRQGVAWIYQATFVDGARIGRADFLKRVERPSQLGAHGYEAFDTKLARHAKPEAILQLCFYSEHIERLQGALPAQAHLVLGDGRLETIRPAAFIAYFRRVSAELLVWLKRYSADAEPRYPEPVAHCDVCDWYSRCNKRWHEDDHLSLVAGLSRPTRKALETHGVKQLRTLASQPEAMPPTYDDINVATFKRVREQARVQARGADEAKIVYDIVLPIEPERGFCSLPPPSIGDVFLDLEGDPYAFKTGLEYLFGYAMLENGVARYQREWALSPSEEKIAFESIVDRIEARRSQHADLHIYHYNHYEPTAFKRLSLLYGTRVDVIDDWLRRDVFVDLLQVVRQALRISVESYSLKKIEPAYGFARSVPLRDANASLQQFEAWLTLGGDIDGRQQLLDDIEAYNRDDCLSTLALHSWLEQLRKEQIGHGQSIPRPEPPAGEVSEKLTAYLAEVRLVEEQLTGDVPGKESERSDQQQARWLLAQLLEWHRREEKAAYWDKIRFDHLQADDLIEDSTALGGLQYVGEVGQVKQSKIHRYRFPPQEHAIDRALGVKDFATKVNVTVEAFDLANGTIDVRRSQRLEPMQIDALIPDNQVDHTALRNALLELGHSVADHGVAGSAAWQPACDLLLRGRPRSLGSASSGPLIQPGEDFLVGATRLVLGLDRSTLAIQGPPGAGKTFTAAKLMCALLAAGKSVGITAHGNEAINTVLSQLLKQGAEQRLSFSIIQKPSTRGESYPHEAVEGTRDNAEVMAALRAGTRVAAGTAWLWASDEMRGAVDVLFVDEASQMSLANVLAVSRGAKNLVLIGDPQQLEQPQKGTHPLGADASALAHLLGDHATLPPELGLFLDQTRRMHEDVCGYISEAFYEGKLRSFEDANRQRVVADSWLSGSGLRFVPVEHTGNQASSPEEAECVARIVTSAFGQRWIDDKGVERPIDAENILVVAPYNAQVRELRKVVPEGVRVGTVDKFQGKEAAIVIYSMAASSAENAPRGMEFLFSLNRFNVAVSRAKCVAVVVANPELFRAKCTSPRQMALVSAHCRFLELATEVRVG